MVPGGTKGFTETEHARPRLDAAATAQRHWLLRHRICHSVTLSITPLCPTDTQLSDCGSHSDKCDGVCTVTIIQTSQMCTVVHNGRSEHSTLPTQGQTIEAAARLRDTITRHPTHSPCPRPIDKNHRNSMSTNISQLPYLPPHPTSTLSLNPFRTCTRASKHTHRPSRLEQQEKPMCLTR